MNTVLERSQAALDASAALLDRGRSHVLGQTLKLRPLRKVYLDRGLRLASTFHVLSAFYLIVALRRPDLLLILGPLLLGYSHLIASYRYTRMTSDSEARHRGTGRDFRLFVMMSLATVCAHHWLSTLGPLGEVPFGAWPILFATISFLYVRWRSGTLSAAGTLLCFGISAALLSYAWHEPILLAGAALIAHNWIAFIYWITAAKGPRAKVSAIACTVLFGAIHWLVWTGHLDGWMASREGDTALAAELSTTGWYLASWTQDRAIWDRALVLYSFGLSMHYFVWLKAVPESLSRLGRPNSFRISLMLLRQDLGRTTLILGTLAATIGTAIWCVSFPLGRTLYFDLALLHGWVELAFLLQKGLSSSVRGFTHRSKTTQLPSWNSGPTSHAR